MGKPIKNTKRYQKYFSTKYLREDKGRVKIYVVDSLKDDEVIYGEGDGFAKSIVYLDPRVTGVIGAIEVKRIPVTYQGLLMNEKTYQKFKEEAAL